jgi:hypothetical protein
MVETLVLGVWIFTKHGRHSALEFDLLEIVQSHEPISVKCCKLKMFHSRSHHDSFGYS